MHSEGSEFTLHRIFHFHHSSSATFAVLCNNTELLFVFALTL